MPQPKRVLRNLKIAEVSTVDKSAGEGTRIVLRKRDDPVAFYRKIFGAETLRDVLARDAANLSLPRFVSVRKDDGGEAIAGTWPRGSYATDDTPDEDDEEEDRRVDDTEEENDDEEAAASKHFVDVLAGLVVDGSEGRISRPAALHWLLHHRDGAALVRRLHKQQKRLQEKEQTMTTTREQDLQQLAKRFGPVKLAKHLIENGPSGLSEVEFTAMVESYAKANGTTFVKMFEALDDDGLAIRKCTQLLKRHPRAEAAPHAAAGGTVSGAYGELMRKAEALRQADPSLTKEQAFSRVYQDASNVEIAKRERAENRPHT